MKRYVVRAALTALFFLVYLLDPIPGSRWYIAWETFAAVAFAIAVVYFSGRGAVFVGLVVALSTIAFPIVILGFVGEQVHGTWSASAVKAMQSIFAFGTLYNAAILLPTVAALVAALACQSWLGPNKSLNPKPLRGSA